MGNRIDILTQTKTTETDDTLVLAPDGTGGVEFRTEAGGGGGSNIDGGDANSTYGGTTAIDGGGA